MINQNETEEAARFFPDKQRAREDYLEQQCMDINSGDKPTDAVAFIVGHCVGQQYMSEELKKLQENKAKLVECLKEIAKQEQEAGMWKVPTYEAQLAQKTLKDIGEEV